MKGDASGERSRLKSVFSGVRAVALGFLLLAPVAGADRLPGNTPSSPVPAKQYSNGCGGEGASGYVVPDTFVVESSGKAKFIVDITRACDIHDAGYAGGIVFDDINGGVVDFSKASRKAVDEGFLRNANLLCERQLKKDPLALGLCQAKAMLYHSMIRKFGSEFFDADPDVKGVQLTGKRDSK